MRALHLQLLKEHLSQLIFIDIDHRCRRTGFKNYIQNSYLQYNWHHSSIASKAKSETVVHNFVKRGASYEKIELTFGLSTKSLFNNKIKQFFFFFLWDKSISVLYHRKTEKKQIYSELTKLLWNKNKTGRLCASSCSGINLIQNERIWWFQYEPIMQFFSSKGFSFIRVDAG